MANNNELETRKSLAALVALARKDQNVAMVMIFDLEKAISDNKLDVDPETDAYKEFALKLYHFRNTSLSGFFDDQSRMFGETDFETLGKGSFYGAGEGIA